jgi:hypothetical protein
MNLSGAPVDIRLFSGDSRNSLVRLPPVGTLLPLADHHAQVQDRMDAVTTNCPWTVAAKRPVLGMLSWVLLEWFLWGV